MSVARHHLAWFKLKCLYPLDSKGHRATSARLHVATYLDLESLRGEFDKYDGGSIPVRHYKHKGKWYAKPLTGGTAQELNMRGISQHRQKYRVFKRIDGKLFRWNFNTLKEAVAKRDAIFA